MRNLIEHIAYLLIDPRRLSNIKIARRIKRLLDLRALNLLLSKSDTYPEHDKYFYFNLSRSFYKRYLYTLCIFLRAKQPIAFKKNYSLLLDISQNAIARRLFKMKNVYFIKERPQHIELELNDQNLNIDYFTNFHERAQDPNNYYVPICMHPNSYSMDLSAYGKLDNKIYRAFFTGSINKFEYQQITRDGKFNCLDRYSLYHLIIRAKELDCKFLKDASSTEGILLNDVFEYPLGPKAYFQLLDSSYFFINLPGVSMPLCHNLIEALYCGTIPILDQEYASYFHPTFEHQKNALIYTGVDDLIHLLQKIQEKEYTLDQLRKMSFEAKHYYEQYLSPHAVVENILNASHKNIYLLGTQNSVKIYHPA